MTEPTHRERIEAASGNVRGWISQTGGLIALDELDHEVEGLILYYELALADLEAAVAERDALRAVVDAIRASDVMDYINDHTDTVNDGICDNCGTTYPCGPSRITHALATLNEKEGS